MTLHPVLAEKLSAALAPMPPVTLRIELLQGYVDTVLFRDVVERYGVSQVAAQPAYEWLLAATGDD